MAIGNFLFADTGKKKVSKIPKNLQAQSTPYLGFKFKGYYHE